MNFSKLNFGIFSLKIYGILLAAAFFFAALKFYRVAREKNFSIDFLSQNFWRWIFSAIFFGRIFAIFLQPEIFFKYKFFSFFVFWDGEINFYGAAAGFFFAAFFDFKKKGENFFRWLDAAAAPILLGIFLADIAGFFTGAIYGTETLLPWGIKYETFGVDILSPTHPVAIYAAIFHFLIFRWSIARAKIYEKFPGKIFFFAAAAFFFADFFLEFFRGNSSILQIGPLRIEQIFDLIFLFLIIFLQKFSKKFNF